MFSCIYNPCVCSCDVPFERGTETLTEEDDDAEEDGDDGASAQTSSHDVLLVSAVSIDVALAHFNPQIGGVGHGQVAWVCDYDGDLIDTTFKEANLQAHLSIVTWETRRREDRKSEWVSDPRRLLVRANTYEIVRPQIKLLNVFKNKIVSCFFRRGVCQRGLNQNSEYLLV